MVNQKLVKNLLLYIYTLGLFLLNFIRIFDNAFWGDEGFTIRLAKMHIPEMIEKTAKDVHPPLYYLFTRLLYLLIGDNGVAYHLSALIPYLIILLIACIFVRKYYGIIPAIVLITMSSIMKASVIYNVEARMYAMASMFVLAAFIAFHRMITRNKLINWIIFLICSLAAAYTHYYALIAVAFFYIMLIPISLKKKEHIKRVIIVYIVTVSVYLPWLSVLIRCFQKTANSWWLNEIPSIKDCMLFLFDNKWIFFIFMISILLFFLTRISPFLLRYKKDNRILQRIAQAYTNIIHSEDTLWIFTGLLSIFGTMLVGLILSYMVRPFFVSRYLFVVSSITYLVLGFCLSQLNPKKYYCILLIIVLLCSTLPAYKMQYDNDITLNNSNTDFLQAVNPPSDATLYTNSIHLNWTLLEYYYPGYEHSYKPEMLETLENVEKEIWLFWNEKMTDDEKNEIEKMGYFSKMIHEGAFANGEYYYAYQVVDDKL